MSIKSTLRKALIFIIPAIVLSSVVVAGAAILQGFQGGTGFGTGNLGNAAVGLNLQVASTSPFLTYTFSAGSGITSLNGSTSSTQTFATSGAPILNISTANGVHTFNISASSTWGLQNTLVFPIPVASTSLSTTGNLKLVGNQLDTVQDIAPTSSPTFSSTTLSGQLTVSTTITIHNVNSEPVITNSTDVVLHNQAGTGGIPRFEQDTTLNNNGCDIIGQDNCLVDKNGSGSALTIGQAIYETSAVGANPQVSLAQANSTSTAKVQGLVATTSVANNGFLYSMRSGILRNVNTAAFTAGDPLYLSCSVAGGLTNARPTTPCLATRIGTVLISNANTGEIDVSIAPAVLGQESGTINPTFNINGANAVTSSTIASNAITSLSQGVGINVSSSSGVGTISNGFSTSSISINIPTPTSTIPTSLMKVYIPYNATVASVRCDEYTTSTTTGITLYKVTADASIQNAGNIVPFLSCSTVATSTTSFTTSTLAAGNYIEFVVTSTTGIPTLTSVHVVLQKL